MKHRFASSLSVEELLDEDTLFSSHEMYALLPLPLSLLLLADFSLF